MTDPATAQQVEQLRLEWMALEDASTTAYRLYISARDALLKAEREKNGR